MALKRSLRELAFITLGCALYGFGLAAVNIPNHLAEGGVTGITLLLRYWIHLDPAYGTIIINIPLIILGYRYLGKRALAYTIYGTLMLAAFIWIWQRVPGAILNLHGDLFIAGVVAGLAGGIGSGVIYRNGGTTGGTDVIARIIEKQRGVSMGKTLLAFDILVLFLSLTYLDIPHMMYTLLASYVFSKMVDFTQDGGYAAKGMLIISNNYQEIADALMDELERGVSFLQAEGGYQHANRPIIYIVISQSEINRVKHIIDNIDQKAFVSIINVHEVLGEGFTYDVKVKQGLFR